MGDEGYKGRPDDLFSELRRDPKFDRNNFYNRLINQIERYHKCRGRDVPPGVEDVIKASLAVRDSFVTFLSGDDSDPRAYDSDLWIPSDPKDYTKYSIEDIFAMIADKTIDRVILSSRPGYYSRKSNIPNVVGLFQQEDNPLAVKLGNRRKLAATDKALKIMQGISTRCTEFQAAYPSCFERPRYQAGILVTDFVIGRPVMPEDWKERTAQVRAYCDHKIGCWLEDHQSRHHIRGKGGGFTFTDGLRPANCVVDNLGFVFVFDVDGYNFRGRADESGEWVSGEIAKNTVLELQYCGLNPTDIGYEYKSGESKLFFR